MCFYESRSNNHYNIANLLLASYVHTVCSYVAIHMYTIMLYT